MLDLGRLTLHSMENTGVLSTSTAVNQRAASGRSATMGHDAAVAAGGIETHDELYEDTPLLSREDTYSEAGSAVDGGDGADGGPPPPGSEWPGTRAFAHLPWWRRPSVLWLLPSLLVHTLAFGGILVPKLTLILELVCRDYFADRALHDPSFVAAPVVFDGVAANPQCDEAVIQKLVSEFTLGLQFIAGAMVMAPRLGALSDRYGRTRVIAFTGLGVFLNELMTILAATYPDTVSVNWLLFGSFLDGLSGTFITAMAITNAYASDCTPPAKRAVVFGWIHGCLFTGIALGPFLANIIIEATGSVLAVFYAAIAVHAVLLPYTYFIVPESLTKERQLEAREKTKPATDSLSTNGHGWHRSPARLFRAAIAVPRDIFLPLGVLWPKGPGASPRLRRNLALLAGIDTILFGVAMGSMTVIVYYSRYMFHWTPVESNTFIATASICRVISVVVVLPIITRLVRGKPDGNGHAPKPNTGSDPMDLWLIRASIVLDTLGFVGYSSAHHGPLFFLSGCVASFGGFGSPTLQSSMTKHAPVEVTGQLLGANGLLHGLARVVAPVVLNLIYAQTVELFPRTVFMVLGAVFGIALVLSFFLKSHGMSKRPPHNTSANLCPVYQYIEEEDPAQSPYQTLEDDVIG